MQKQLIQGTSVHPVRVVRDRGFLSENDLARDGGVDGEHAPVHEASVAEVGIVDFFGGPLEDFVDDVLGGLGLGFVDEEFDGGGK